MTVQDQRGAERAGRLRQVVERQLPGVPVLPLSALPSGLDCGSEPGCARLQASPERDCAAGCMFSETDFMVGDHRTARFLLGGDDPAVRDALAGGKVVVFARGLVRDGMLTLRTRRDADVLRVITVPALEAPREADGVAHAQMLIPHAVARRTGLPVTTAGFAVDRVDHRVSPAEQKRVEEALAGVSTSAEVYVERGFEESFTMPLVLLAVVGAVLVLGGSLIATGLSAADAKPDLATLAAVGARPRTRRLLMMGQAGFVGLLGCWLGLAAGLVPGIAVAFPLTSDQGTIDTSAPRHGVIIDIPFQLLAAVGIAVPLVAMVAAGLFTRSRLPALRRIG
jgi:putative ABC transport system permease protein